MRVLFIDDESDTERFQSKVEWLRDEGIHVESIGVVEEVLPFLQSNAQSIEAIILDILMPPHDYYSLEETNDGTTTGLRLLKDIHSKYPDIPVVIVSVKRGLSHENLQHLGARAYLEKPALSSQIAQAVRRAVER